MNRNKVVMVLALAAILAVGACSRQQSDWEKTRAANTTDAYELFLKKYPTGEFTAQAQARVKELYEERDWQKTRDADTAEAYQAFLKQYPEGKYTEEARIRVENFSLAAAPAGSSPPGDGVADSAAEPPAAAASAPPAPAAPPAHAAPVIRPPAASAPSNSKHAEAAGKYAIQLGAFKSGADAAHKRWAELNKKYPQLLRGLTPKVAPAKVASGTLYRLQVPKLSDRQAHVICSHLRSDTQACVVIRPAKA